MFLNLTNRNRRTSRNPVPVPTRATEPHKLRSSKNRKDSPEPAEDHVKVRRIVSFSEVVQFREITTKSGDGNSKFQQDPPVPPLSQHPELEQIPDTDSGSNDKKELPDIDEPPQSTPNFTKLSKISVPRVDMNVNTVMISWVNQQLENGYKNVNERHHAIFHHKKKRQIARAQTANGSAYAVYSRIRTNDSTTSAFATSKELYYGLQHIVNTITLADEFNCVDLNDKYFPHKTSACKVKYACLKQLQILFDQIKHDKSGMRRATSKSTTSTSGHKLPPQQKDAEKARWASCTSTTSSKTIVQHPPKNHQEPRHHSLPLQHQSISRQHEGHIRLWKRQELSPPNDTYSSVNTTPQQNLSDFIEEDDFREDSESSSIISAGLINTYSVTPEIKVYEGIRGDHGIPTSSYKTM
ncbi:unnamed protein product [Allacma fusca]|uniref:Uncharacterized protein n=1 Tax=Allacma fusca TaxID=39272 RepID=A0A8J2LVT2_9HEXA|nr:unnamed protein product [Allacma fusca]